MKKYLIIIIVLLFPLCLAAQNKADSLSVRWNWRGLEIRSHGKTVKNMHRLYDILQPNEEALHYYRKARVARTIGLPISATAVGCLVAYDVWGISRPAGTRHPPDALLYASGGLVLATVPFTIIAFKNEWLAVAAYNHYIHGFGYHYRQPECYIAFTGNGLGLGVKF